MERVPDEALARLRRLPCQEALEILGVYHKRDAAFSPKKDPSTARYFVEAKKFTGELIVTGPRFYCPDLGRGGMGAIDLAILLLGATLRGAVARLGG